MRLRLEPGPWACFAVAILGFACQGRANVGARAAASPTHGAADGDIALQVTHAPPGERSATTSPPDVVRDDSGLEPTSSARTPREPRDSSRERSQRAQRRGQRVVLPGNLVFRTGSAELAQTPENTEILSQLVGFLQEQEQVTLLRIEGHTDAVGDEQANLELSGQRALTIKRALSDRGIAPERLIAVGFGESQPLASNEAAAGRAMNRRTEFRIAEIRGTPTSNLGPLAGGTEFK